MANTGPDGVNRCGAFRGRKCEQKRYLEQMEKEGEASKREQKGSMNIVAILSITIVIVIAAIVFMRIKTKTQ